MTGDDYKELLEDIRANGLRELLILYEDKILDGRNRLMACLEAGVEPRYRPLPAGEDPLAFVISRNLHRRHLTTQQRSAIAAELAKMKVGRPGKASVDAISDAQAAKAMKVSERSVERAKKRMRLDPEAHAKAKAGLLPYARRERERDDRREDMRGRTNPDRLARLHDDLKRGLGIVLQATVKIRELLENHPDAAQPFPQSCRNALNGADAAVKTLRKA